jgi:hypothetical protein
MKDGVYRASGERYEFGSKTCAQLAKDFAEWRARAALHAEKVGPQEAEGFIALYADMAKAFSVAARGGAVVFQ